MPDASARSTSARVSSAVFTGLRVARNLPKDPSMQSRSVAVPRTDVLVSTVAVVSVALLTALAAQISITLPGTPVPQTLQTMAVLGGSAYLGSRRGLAAMLLYVGMGLFLPFYAGGAQGWSEVTGASVGDLLKIAADAAILDPRAPWGKLFDRIRF